MSVFVIINEWTPMGTDYDLREVVGNEYFTSEDSAWDALSVIASQASTELSPQEISLVIEPGVGIESDIYYIEELNNGQAR